MGVVHLAHSRHLILSLLWLSLGCGGASPPAYQNAGGPVEARVRDLLARMTPEEKFWQLYALPDNLESNRQRYAQGVFGLQIRTGATAAQAADRINAIQRYFLEESRLGIPIIPFEEALHGLVAPGATVFPQAIGLAATWDTAIVGRVAQAIARETITRGIRQVLSPVLNIATDVRWGRVEETYGEDPFLTTAMGVAFIQPFETAGIVTTPKHFVANVGDGGRDSYPIDWSARLLREVHFPPFQAALQQGHARSVMASYNSVDGLPATASPWLLTEVLRKEWGFAGYVFGDAGATGGANVLHFTSRDYTESTARAVNAGLDVIFQTSYDQYPLFYQAFKSGLIPEQRVNAAVARVLRTKFALGLFDNPYADTAAAARANGASEHRALALDAARKSITLLTNERHTLPIATSIRSIAVIGTDADQARLGGYSGPGNQPISILEGIRQVVSAGTRVGYAPGPGRSTAEFVTIEERFFPNGLRAELFDNIALEGAPRIERTDRQVDFSWTIAPPDSTLPLDWYSLRWTGALTVPGVGTVRIGVDGNDGFRLFLDGQLVLDNWRKQSAGRHIAQRSLAPGRSYQVRLEYYENTGSGRVKLIWDHGAATDAHARIAAAAALARNSAAAVVTVGLEEGEFRDRSSLALPGHQEALIEAVAATGTPTVVVIIGGSAVTMRWLDQVDAVVDAWYPGEVGGRAVAEVLFGTVNPAGRLPISFPRTEGQLPLTYYHKPTGRGDDYLDQTGQPLFPFGFGLSYTTFQYSALALEPASAVRGGTVVVRFQIRNIGARAGDEVVQLYLRDEFASIARPVMQLAGFQRIHLRAGEQREIAFTLTPTQLSLLDGALKPVLEAGTFRVMVGASSKDIRLRGILTVQ